MILEEFRRMVSASVFCGWGNFSVDFQGAEKNCALRNKEWFGWVQQKCFFDFLIIQMMLYYGDLKLTPAVLDAAVLERNCHRAPAQPMPCGSILVNVIDFRMLLIYNREYFDVIDLL